MGDDMTIRRLSSALVTAGLAAITFVGLTPVGAQAANQPPPGATGPSAAAAPDGNFYAFEHRNFEGRWCSWAGNDGWWGDSCGGFDNIASSVWNNGYPSKYSTVKLLKHANTLRNPSMCLNVGDYWADLDLGYEVFSDGTKSNDQISAHHWIWLQQRNGPYYSCT